MIKAYRKSYEISSYFITCELNKKLTIKSDKIIIDLKAHIYYQRIAVLILRMVDLF